MTKSPFTVNTFHANNRTYGYYSITEAGKEFKRDVTRLPYCIRILLESAMRRCDGLSITRDDVAGWFAGLLRLTNGIPWHSFRRGWYCRISPVFR
jgi:aconitase A